MEIQEIEQKLWQAADKLLNNMDAAEYKHVVLGLIFLKYISDSFEEKNAKLQANLKPETVIIPDAKQNETDENKDSQNLFLTRANLIVNNYQNI